MNPGQGTALAVTTKKAKYQVHMYGADASELSAATSKTKR